MGKLFDFFGKSKKQQESKQQEEIQNQTTKDAPTENQDQKEASFAFGVQDTFRLQNSNDLVVVGRVKGTVTPGMAVYISNFGDDNGVTSLTTILSLEIDQNPVDVAKDTLVALRLEAGQKLEVKIGSVIFTREISQKEVHDAYITAIGDTYVVRKNMDLTEEELAQMSITDCAEAWRLFSWFHSKNKEQDTQEDVDQNRQKIDKLASVLCKKILSADEIYTVVNKATGEPNMFSHTVDQQDGTYMCTPPDIMLISKAYAKAYENLYSPDQFVIQKIENGEKKDGIYNFLGSSFYLNGACGVAVLSDQTAVDASMLVPKPDYKDMPQINIPVTNPDLMRWMLLLGQLGHPNTADEELIYKLYYRFMSLEMTKATFIVPMQSNGEIPPGDKEGKTILKEGVEIQFPTIKGKYDKDAIRMYTDWKRLHMEYGADWNGFIQPISGMIDSFDCAINATKYPQAGCYISKEMYEEMQSMALKED